MLDALVQRAVPLCVQQLFLSSPLLIAFPGSWRSLPSSATSLPCRLCPPSVKRKTQKNHEHQLNKRQTDSVLHALVTSWSILCGLPAQGEEGGGGGLHLGVKFDSVPTFSTPPGSGFHGDINLCILDVEG